MNYSHLLKIWEESGLSAEEFGELFGLSGMTLRRWESKNGREKLPRIYALALREICYDLVAKGLLSHDSKTLEAVLTGDKREASFRAALHSLGLKSGFRVPRPEASNNWEDTLSQIGNQESKQDAVENGKNKIFSYKKMGTEWSSRITSLWQVVTSKKLTQVDKLVAYGALFYLISPIDFIPDHIPVVGLMDDFFVLGIAVAYYASRMKSGALQA